SVAGAHAMRAPGSLPEPAHVSHLGVPARDQRIEENGRVGGAAQEARERHVAVSERRHEERIQLAGAANPVQAKTQLPEPGERARTGPDRDHLRAAGLESLAKDARARIGGIVRAEERDPHRRPSPISDSQRRAYLVKTEKAASPQRT